MDYRPICSVGLLAVSSLTSVLKNTGDEESTGQESGHGHAEESTEQESGDGRAEKSGTTPPPSSPSTDSGGEGEAGHADDGHAH
ncbi:hypothetical protein [Streptomyces sp. A012304]|uniref:hypothetical protein n=1 Tax=Streptomyces sp. A012304 TaxID=375446 RepID=UPI00223295A1|nr:hypothetical protein [Streptomyces sp. A012304]GKQ36035.1 hypothetical protein ALMP_25780 [Streptomyces sp. A012304]